MDAVAQAIDDCRSLTARMLEAAECGDWQTVSTLDAERRAGFDGLDVTALHPDALESVLDAFRTVLIVDGRLRDRAVEARDATVAELRKVRGRRHGQARYREQALRG